MSEQNGIFFHDININSLYINSGVFIGENYQPLWSSHNKNNNGMGNMNGKNIVHGPTNFIYDPDYFDYSLFAK